MKKEDSEFYITVEDTRTGTEFTLKVKDYFKIGRLSEIIAERLGVPAKRHSLVYQGEELSSDYTFEKVRRQFQIIGNAKFSFLGILETGAGSKVSLLENLKELINSKYSEVEITNKLLSKVIFRSKEKIYEKGYIDGYFIKDKNKDVRPNFEILLGIIYDIRECHGHS
ncbi:MAG: ubiquitin-like domain-containing protein [Promethearchaeia archaeon]